MSIHLNLPPNGKRLIYDLTHFGIPEIPYLAAQNLPYTTAALPTHIHKGCMEINHVLKGERVYRVAGQDYHLTGNQVFVTWPDEVHDTGAYLHGRALHFWLQVRLPRVGEAFVGMDGAMAAPLVAALWDLPRRQFRADSGMRSVYARILSLCREGPAPLASIQLCALLSEWLLMVVASSKRAREDEITPDIAKALELAEKDPNAHFSIGQLAEAACLSESRFKGKFKDQLGMPPGEYLLRRRLDKAAALLLEGKMNITEIAFTLEFSSSQHFSATFKRFFGKSPAVWSAEQSGHLAERRDGGGGEAAGGARGGLTPWIDEEGVLHGHICRPAVDG